MNRSFIVWQTGLICVLNTIFEHWIWSSGSTDKHTCSVLFRNTARLNLQFDILYFNAAFTLVVRMMNPARWNFHFDMCKQRSNTLFRLKNMLVQFCGEHAGLALCWFCVLDTGFALVYQSRCKAPPDWLRTTMARIVPSLQLAKTEDHSYTLHLTPYILHLVGRSRIFPHRAFFAGHYSLLGWLVGN